MENRKRRPETGRRGARWRGATEITRQGRPGAKAKCAGSGSSRPSGGREPMQAGAAQAGEGVAGAENCRFPDCVARFRHSLHPALPFCPLAPRIWPASLAPQFAPLPVRLLSPLPPACLSIPRALLLSLFFRLLALPAAWGALHQVLVRLRHQVVISLGSGF